MRYASEKLEIIELVEQSTLSVGRTLTSIGIPRSTSIAAADSGEKSVGRGRLRMGLVSAPIAFQRFHIKERFVRLGASSTCTISNVR